MARIRAADRGRYDRPVEAILFDWDGTLIDSLGAFHRANATVMEAFGQPFDAVRYQKHYVPDWLEMYRRRWDERFDELEQVVAELTRKEKSDERKKRK